MQATFYQPTPKRHKILCEKGAFPTQHVSVSVLLDYAYVIKSFWFLIP